MSLLVFSVRKGLYKKVVEEKKSKGILSERSSLLSFGVVVVVETFKNRPFSQYYHCCLSWKLEKTFESEYDFFPPSLSLCRISQLQWSQAVSNLDTIPSFLEIV